jgi:predicted transcriptional regulator
MDRPAYIHAQRVAMEIITDWVNTKKTPVPKQEVFKGLVLADVSESTARKSIDSLIKKGCIRRTIDSGSSRGTFYVYIRPLSSGL